MHLNLQPQQSHDVHAGAFQASERYEAATRLRPASHAALYNWGVALSDMARVVRGSDRAAAAGYLMAAADKYSLSLHLNAANPQVSHQKCSAAAGSILGMTLHVPAWPSDRLQGAQVKGLVL